MSNELLINNLKSNNSEFKSNNEGKQIIEEMAKVLKDYTERNHIMASHVILECYAEELYSKNYRKQSEVDLREEITTDDFGDLELAKERGWHRKKFYCPNCDLLIKIETWDSERMFGGGTILKSNEMPKYCPNCGAKMKGGAEE